MSSVVLAVTLALAVELPDAVQAEVAQAEAAGLPSAPFEEKAREGLAKGVPEGRIVSVLDGMEVDLGHAKDVLGLDDPSGELLVAASRALDAGVSEGTVRRLGSDEILGVLALSGVADLVAQGFSESQAVGLVEAGLASGAPERSLTGLASAASSLLHTGASHAQVSGALSAAVVSGRSPLSSVPASEGGPPEHANNDNPNSNRDKDKEKTNNKGGKSK